MLHRDFLNDPSTKVKLCVVKSQILKINISVNFCHTKVKHFMLHLLEDFFSVLLNMNTMILGFYEKCSFAQMFTFFKK